MSMWGRRPRDEIRRRDLLCLLLWKQGRRGFFHEAAVDVGGDRVLDRGPEAREAVEVDLMGRGQRLG